MKHRKSSHPPLIILLDLLFVLVFILIMDSDDGITITIPEKKLFDNAILVYRSGSSEFIINKQDGSVGNEPLEAADFYYYQRCDDQCSSYNVDYKDKMYIYFPNDLFNDISKLTFLAADTSFNCKNIQFDITQKGEIDLDLLFSNNPCLNRIPGSQYLFTEVTEIQHTQNSWL